MSFRRISAFACLAVATGMGVFPTSAHACGLFNWLWGNDAQTAYYAPYAAYSPPVCDPCGGGAVVAQRPQVMWMPVANYGTTVNRVPVTVYRPSTFGNAGGGGLFGCNLFGNQVNRVPVYTPTTSFMPPACNTCPTTSYMPPVSSCNTCPTTTFMPPASSCNTCPTTSYSLPVTTTYAPPVTTTDSCGCSSCNCSSSSTTSYSPATTTYSAPVESAPACNCKSHGSVGSTTRPAAGSFVGSPSTSYPTSTYSNGFAPSSNGSSSIPADVRPSLSVSDSPTIDGNSLGLPETSYSVPYDQSSSMQLSAPAVRSETTVTPGPIRVETESSFNVPQVRPFESSVQSTTMRPTATEPVGSGLDYGVNPMRDPETRGSDGRLLAPPLLDPRAKTAAAPASARPQLAFDDRIPVLPASLTVNAPADLTVETRVQLAPASFAPSAKNPAIETTGLHPIDNQPVRSFAPSVEVSRKAPVSFEAAPAYSTGSNVTQLDESVWQSARQ